METLTGLLRERARSRPGGIAYQFESFHPPKLVELTWGELWVRACRLARRSGPLRGQTVLLLFPPGLDFHVAFFGALLAGARPLAVQAPNPKMRARTLAQVDEASRAGHTKRVWTLSECAPEGYSCLLLDEPEASDDDPPDSSGDIAYFQLTSGSTGVSRAIPISQANALWMCRALGREAEGESGLVCCGWLPLYHDMGLVLSLLSPLVLDGRAHLISAFDFLQKPLRWLLCLSQQRATHTAAPNFAYQLCLDRLPEKPAGLDLSSLRRAFNGSEAVDPETVQQFSERFGAPVYPCYGLAEATLMVSGARGSQGCGYPLCEVEVSIRDKGEVWVRGPGVASGLADPEGWLATGDCGFLQDGQLHINGRLKELLILHGVNYPPQFFERAAGPGVVAFSVPAKGGERLVLQVESRVGKPLQEVERAVARATGILPHRVERVGRIPRTSSGKFQRRICRQNYLERCPDDTN